MTVVSVETLEEVKQTWLRGITWLLGYVDVHGSTWFRRHSCHSLTAIPLL